MANRRQIKKNNKRNEKKLQKELRRAQLPVGKPIRKTEPKTETPNETPDPKKVNTAADPVMNTPVIKMTFNTDEKQEAGKDKTKTMKSRFIVQYQGHEIEQQEILAQIKQKWKEAGNKVKDLKELDMYVKLEDGKVYYTINGAISDSITVF